MAAAASFLRVVPLNVYLELEILKRNKQFLSLVEAAHVLPLEKSPS